MKVYELLQGVEVQSELHVVVYDDLKNERVKLNIANESVRFADVDYMYVDEGELYWEVSVFSNLEMDEKGNPWKLVG